MRAAGEATQRWPGALPFLGQESKSNPLLKLFAFLTYKIL